jgi:L-lactate dehydrogenase complex protein LldF
MATGFKTRASEALADGRQRAILTRAMAILSRWRSAAIPAPEGIHHLQATAGAARRHALAHLPSLLQQMEQQVLAHGGIVYWAEDAAAANAYVVQLARQRASLGMAGQRSQPVRVVKSRSHIGAEIGLNTALEAAGVQVLDTQLGDYILQMAGGLPSHPVFPALHLRKEYVATLFEQRLDMPQTMDIQAMASMARYKQRKALLEADIGVSEVAFAVAETGRLALVSLSGNERMAAFLPPLHVMLMGIGDVVATEADLELLLQAYSTTAIGQPFPRSVTLISGPAGPEELDGPEELHLVIVDNGRTELMRLGYGEVLACIRCGACHSACPVYREVGGTAYGGPVAGPIGAVVLPLIPTPAVHEPAPASSRLRLRPQRGDARPQPTPPALEATPFADLPHASTVCGACADVCPVGIDIPRLLVRLRGDLAHGRRTPAITRQSLHLWTWAMSDITRYRRLAGILAAAGQLPGRRFLPLPAGRQDWPTPARRSFRERWQPDS